jgi:hypothetical protein
MDSHLGDGHLSDEQLAAFEEGDLPAGDTVHLESCPHCAGRLREIESALAAYREYRDAVRAPLLPPPPRSWTPFDTLIAQNANNRRSKMLRWWPRIAIAAATCTVIIALVQHQRSERPSIRANELLARSAMVILPEARLISLRSGDRVFIRPAVLATDAPRESDPNDHLRSLFVAAHYSWRDPFSARSFREWRNSLREKRDSVSVIRQSGKEESYRLRTDSLGGVLRSVSLTLRAADLRPTDETFAFAGEGPLDLSEAPAPMPEASQARPPVARELPTETLAGPEDTLHVLAALDAIGADVGDPIDVSEDPAHRHVVVRGSGLAPERRKLVAEALKPLPRVVLEFDYGGSAASAAQPPPAATAERYSTDVPADFRRQLEDRFGGAVALQQATDRVLETCASLLARAVALQTLAVKFPPSIADPMTARDHALLKKLQQHHVSELRRLLVRMRTDLQPLLPSSTNAAPAPGADWQSGVPALVASARDTDNLLNHLLAGSYNQATGQDMLHRVASEIERLDEALETQEQGGR